MTNHEAIKAMPIRFKKLSLDATAPKQATPGSAGFDLTAINITQIDDKTIKRPRIGFDACFVPMLLHSTHINKNIVDSCEGGFFSVYVDHNLNVSPCSFSGAKDQYNLKEFDFYDIWNNRFREYRVRQTNKCSAQCLGHDNCRGCCPYYPLITVCYEHTY